MKFGGDMDLDATDLHILSILQDDCKQPLAKVGDQVGLSPPSVIERIKKLEEAGVILDYRAILDARKIGKDVTAFIGVEISHPKLISAFEIAVSAVDELLECHHVTGQHTLLLKVKTSNTATLEDLIRQIRSIEGVTRTETMVVLSTHTERTQISLPQEAADHRPRPSASGEHKRIRRNGDKHLAHAKRALA
ncbi:MAG TPA: Lrp/AsnC family transcriptional regulator [Candidatus Binatia bacterium]|nr:Lrp/AsnC family transcriptional regulator [Candidatus Binatia bacterium]